MDEDVTVAVRGGQPVRIAGSEIELSATRTGGPGGQHVNTSDTTAVLRFDLAASPSLSEDQKQRAIDRLGRRVSADGVLQLRSGDRRSQLRNREAVLERFAELLADALAPPAPPRRPTRPSRAAREARLDDKRHQAERKSRRRPPERD